jgi:hypothetical protein
MIYEGKEEVLFERDVVLVDMVSKYFVIKKIIEENRYPSHSQKYIELFKSMYQIELGNDEMEELKDFAENDFNDFMNARILDQRIDGMEDLQIY